MALEKFTAGSFAGRNFCRVKISRFGSFAARNFHHA